MENEFISTYWALINGSPLIFYLLGIEKKMYAVFTKNIHEISANSSAGLALLSNRNYSMATFF